MTLSQTQKSDEEGIFPLHSPLLLPRDPRAPRFPFEWMLVPPLFRPKLRPWQGHKVQKDDRVTSVSYELYWVSSLYSFMSNFLRFFSIVCKQIYDWCPLLCVLVILSIFMNYFIQSNTVLWSILYFIFLVFRKLRTSCIMFIRYCMLYLCFPMINESLSLQSQEFRRTCMCVLRTGIYILRVEDTQLMHYTCWKWYN